MRFRGLLLILVISFLCLAPVSAGTCFAESDCPKCTIDGMKMVSSKVTTGGLIGEKYPIENLACNYESEKVKTENPHMPDLYDSMEVHVACYNDAATASQWYNWEMGTGEKPVPFDPAQESRSELYVGKIRCIAGLGPYKKTGSSTYYASMGCTPNYTVNGQYLTTFRPHTYYTYQEGNEPKDLRNKLLAWDQKYIDCFAGFSPKPAPAAGEKTLHGTVIATHHPYGTPQPLKYAEVDLMVDGKPAQITRTDAEGSYNFSVSLQKGKEYQIDVVLVYATPEKYYFEIRNAGGKEITGRDQGKIVEFSHSFTYSGDADLEQDIDLENLDPDLSTEKLRELGVTGTDLYPVNPEGLMYVQMTEVLEYYRNVLNEDPRHGLPVVVYMWANDPSAYYLYNSGIIVIGQRVSNLGLYHKTLPRQRHTVFHEFSHYMMEDIYGKMPERVSDNNALEINHGGYTNPRTSDSWIEGFAEFMPVVISDFYGHNQCGIFSDRENLDADNTQAWGVWNAEEYAAAEVLWDLYDNPEQMKACDYRMRTELQKISASPATDDATKNTYARIIAASQARENSRGYIDDDPGSIPWAGLWAVIRTYHPDVASVYAALATKYPAQKGYIDSLFVGHGFFRNTGEGDKVYTFGEPFRDTNNNRIRETGEYFVDLPANRTFRDGFPIGSASNYQRPQRRSTMDIPGHYIRVNNAVPFYTYMVEYPGTGYLPYLSTVENVDGSIYVQVPPNPDAKITVSANGVTTGNPLVFTSEEFDNQYENSLKQGYYVSHDFRISGPIPTVPGRSGPSGSGLSGSKGTDFFTAKGPLYDLVSGHAESRVPLIVSIPIIIAVLLVLVYVLKKKL